MDCTRDDVWLRRGAFRSLHGLADELRRTGRDVLAEDIESITDVLAEEPLVVHLPCVMCRAEVAYELSVMDNDMPTEGICGGCSLDVRIPMR